MQKWAYFSMGAMAGIIAILASALVLQHGSMNAYAASQQDPTLQSGKLMMVAGMSTQNQADILWILHEHEAIPALKKLDDEDEAGKDLRKGTRLSLMMYKVERNGDLMKLVSSRDVSFDEELMDYGTDKPSVASLKEQMKKQIDKRKKKD